MDISAARTTTLDALARAAIRIFRPMVRILLRHNVSYKTCAEWLRWCYADVAYHDFELPGRKQSKSRVAVLTGLTRIDVNQLLATPAPDQVRQEEQYHRAALVLAGWANNPRFSAGGKPIKVLPFETDSDDEPSFSQLVALHSGGTPARAVLDELARNGTVKIRPDRRIELQQRSWYITRARDADINFAEVFGLACGELVKTIDHNWQPDQEDKRLQLLVYNPSIHPQLAAQARDRVESAARELVENIDKWLYEFERQSGQLDPNDEQPRVRLGLGLYYFE
ncbi:MAG: DUF6502 family protein [Wenzhouxiangellaceae bacterium]|nr:DUF6502 family protein [Wenzhouxiangellaceae bacterium]